MTSRIVVGVDNSSDALRALEWALRIAGPLGAHVRAVHAYAPPGVYFPYSTHTAEEMHDTLEKQARAEAEQALEEVLASIQAPEGVTVEPAVIRDRPAEALLTEAREADMLVVGSRGHGGFAGLLLGSVSQQCVHHATCPVVVVPPPERS